MLNAVRAIVQLKKLRSLDAWKSAIRACLKSGCLAEAKRVFDSIPAEAAADDELVVTCTAMVAAYTAAGRTLDAKLAFDRIGNPDVVAWNAMLSCYANRGSVDNARAVFHSMPRRNVITWNAMVSGLVNHGREPQAQAVQRLQAAFNDVSLDLSFQIHVGSGASQVQVKAAFDALPFRRIATWTNLMKFFDSQGLKEEAGMVYERMPMHDLLSGSVCISCSDTADKAKLHFDLMQEHNLFTWTSLLAAYAGAGCPSDMVRVFTRMPKYSLVTCSAALYGYVRAGYMEKAASLFWGMPERSAMTWKAMLGGYADEGRTADAMTIFRLMLLEGEAADYICFIRVLAMCSHVGKVEDGRHYFLSMQADHGVEADIEHYTSVVDMLGRAGHLNEAEELLGTMPFLPSTSTLHALAGACSRSRNNGERLERLFSLALDSGIVNSASYVILCNGRRDEVPEPRGLGSRGLLAAS